jgi:predicted HicB family RNase H-like nuclease
MDEIMRILVLIILGLAGITRFQARKTKDLKKEVQEAQDTFMHKVKEMDKLNEVQQKITAIKSEDPPARIDPPEHGDAVDRLDRLNRLHERANTTGQ